jgi:hypothetical protein
VSSSANPNPLAVAWSVWTALRTIRAPLATGSDRWENARLLEPLGVLQRSGPAALPELTEPIGEYVADAQSVDPDGLARDEALAFWINLYNAGALLLAADARARGSDSVLRVPGGFRRPFVSIAGEELSLDAVEHAKVRRFGDPRAHAALVCGSVSCPTLRYEPYRGAGLSAQLDDQMRTMLAGGAMTVDRNAGTVSLSRIFLWFGADFARPDRMPSFVPARRSRVLHALEPWMGADVREWVKQNDPKVDFQAYDWGLGCTVG